MFDIGQQVVCIDDRLYPGEPGPHVVKGAVYTISSINREHTFTTLLFHEFAVNVVEGWCVGYLAECFRPLRKTDISALTKILKRRQNPALTSAL